MLLRSEHVSKESTAASISNPHKQKKLLISSMSHGFRAMSRKFSLQIRTLTTWLSKKTLFHQIWSRARRALIALSSIATSTQIRKLSLRATSARRCAAFCASSRTKDIPLHSSKTNIFIPITKMSNKFRRLNWKTSATFVTLQPFLQLTPKRGTKRPKNQC